MRTWMADLAGLMIGFAVGGAVLVHFLPQIERLARPKAAVPSVVRPAPPPRMPPPPARTTRPPAVQAPTVAMVLAPDPAPLPHVIYPDQPQPEQPPPKPGTGDAGTGFFVADRLVMTAAHVVNACQRMEIMSPYVHLTAASLVARDPRHDIALVRSAGAAAPAVLGIGRPAALHDRVFVLGYPSSAGPKVAEETWGTLENDRMPAEPKSLTNVGEMVWMQALDVRHGYSGGPIFDPRTGLVAGIVRGTVDGDRLRSIPGMPRAGIDIGPGSAQLSRFLQDEEPGVAAQPASQWGEDPLSVARRATVHVVCWH